MNIHPSLWQILNYIIQLIQPHILVTTQILTSWSEPTSMALTGIEWVQGLMLFVGFVPTSFLMPYSYFVKIGGF